MTKSIIEYLIEGSEEKIRLAQEAKEAESKKIIEGSLVSLKEYLGQFWVMLAARAEETGEKYNYTIQWDDNSHTSATIFYEIPALPEHRLAPISIKWGPHALHPNYYDFSQKFKVNGSYYPNLEDALRAAREGYDKYIEGEEKKRLDWYNDQFKIYAFKPRKTEGEIRSIVDQLKSEFPDKAEKADKILAEWLRLRDDQVKEEEDLRRAEETRETERALHETLRIKYILELSQWIKARDAIEELNKKIAQEIQDAADLSEYRVYKLTYAIVAKYEEDGEEETAIETRSVYTFQSKADPAGYWMVDGKLTRYYHLVSLEALDVHPSSGILSIHVEKAGIDFHFYPYTLKSRIPEILSAIQDLPEEPEHPEELGYLASYVKREYIERARELIQGEGEKEGEENV